MEIFSALLAICAGNSPVTGEFPTQRPMTRSFDVYFDLRPNERLSKQWWGWWFETLSRSLWRHRNVKFQAPICQFSTPWLFWELRHFPGGWCPRLLHSQVIKNLQCSGKLLGEFEFMFPQVFYACKGVNKRNIFCLKHSDQYDQAFSNKNNVIVVRDLKVKWENKGYIFAQNSGVSCNYWSMP